MGGRLTIPVLFLTALLALALGAPVFAQGGGYEGGGYGYTGGGGYNPDSAGRGRVNLKITARQKQRSDKAVKVKATCGRRACMLDIRGRFKSDRGRAKLKPRRDVAIRAGETRKLTLKLNKKARRAVSKADRAGVLVKGKAIGAGGGGKDKDKERIRLV